MTPNNTSSSANSTQNAPVTPTASSTSASVSAPSSSTSRLIYPRPSSSSNHPAPSKSSLPTTKWHELPRLQLAPPEHQKQPHAQVKQLLLQQQQEQQQQQQQQQPQQRTVLVPNAGSPASVSSSRSASPTPEDPNKAGDKRKSASVNPNTKKRRTEQPSQQQYQVRPDYSFAAHYSQSYYPPTASTSTSSLNYQSPVATISHSPIQASRQTPSTSVSNNYSTFNEFQWRLLHLCSEFYEAATELIRSTPPPVLSQAFQLINNGTGTDPISVLNDARRACDMLITNPQSLAVPPPFPSPIPMPTLNSLLHLNARSLSGPPPSIPMTTHSPSLPSATATPPYPPASAPPAARTSADLRPQDDAPKNAGSAANFTSIAQSGQVQGTWKEHELAKLKELAEKYRIRKKDGKIPIDVPEEVEEAEDAEEVEEEEEEKSPTAQTEGVNSAPTDTAVEGTSGDADAGNTAASLAKKNAKDFDEVDWDQVVAEFGDERSRHQILIKATFLGLKPSSSLPGVKKKKKKKRLPAQPFTQLLTNVALPPPTAAAATSNTSHGAAAPSAQVLTLTPAATLTSGASATAFYNSLRHRPGAGASSQYAPAPTARPHAPGGTTSSSKSTAQLPSARSSDKTASSTTGKAQSTTTTTPTVPPPPTITAAASTMASPTTVGISNVSAYGVPPPPWGYPPPSAAMAQSVTGQSATPYYPYAGMYYSQGYPIQSYSIPGGPTIQGVAPVGGGPGGPPPPLFVQTHPHYNPPHARRNAPVGQTFYAYVPRTEDNPGPKKPTKKNGAGAATATATTGPTSSTFVVPNASNISPKTSRSDQTATDRPASATPAATPKSTGAEP